MFDGNYVSAPISAPKGGPFESPGRLAPIACTAPDGPRLGVGSAEAATRQGAIEWVGHARKVTR